MSVTYYKLIIAYDGTNFIGWQEQANGRTVQGVLKETFKQIFHENCSIVGASRTDAGVHANYQTVRINTKINITPEKLRFAWSNRLPLDIAIKNLEKLTSPEQFHPQHNILQKTYHYNFYVGQPDPFLNRTALHWHWPLDEEKLKKALTYFVGTKDFRSFCSSDDKNEDTVRTIDSIELKMFSYASVSAKVTTDTSTSLNTSGLSQNKPVHPELVEGYTIEFKGKAFLHHMVRRITGACLEVASKANLELNVLQEALDKKDPEQILLNAPARGLILYDITYHAASADSIRQ